MKTFLLIFGGVMGGMAVLLGAFGAHALKKILDKDLLASFETGVRYQMYHALIIIICGLTFSFTQLSEQIMGWCFILGVVFFSFSIYALVLSAAKDRKWKFLGPVTPLGGLLLLGGWILFTYNVYRYGIFL